ncbi:C2H2 zinc finger [Ceratobasidium sp. AG-Ba]|nr:C2H2 zinc finger [Ceratobasidium sp. AG-Ba]
MRPRFNVIPKYASLRDPSGKLTSGPQTNTYSRRLARFPQSGQTSDEESNSTSESSFEYESSGDETSSEPAVLSTSTMSKPKPSTKFPEYIIVNGKLCAKSRTAKPYACTHEGCGKSYRKPSRLEEHERSHTGERPFICETCQNSYMRESHLRAHSRSHLPASDRPFVCTHQVLGSKEHQHHDQVPTQPTENEASTSTTRSCNQRFWTSQHLRAHELAIHLGEKPYKCDSCPAGFVKHGALRVHMAENHALPGTKPYQCEQSGCTQSFSTNQKLKIHSRTHDVTRYACAHPDCSITRQDPVQFATWTQLQAHMRSDHPPKCPHESCNGRTFKSSKGLRGHLKTHEDREREEKYIQTLQSASVPATGSKRAHAEQDSHWAEPPLKRRRGGEMGRDWPCPQEGCDKAFKSKKAQSDHVRVSHEGSRNFPCPKDGCTQAFGYKHVMQRHLERHHRETAPSPPTPIAESSIEALIGHQRSAKNRPRLIACPWPNAFGPEPSISAGMIRTRCAFKFSRAYDLRRHLKSAHCLEVEADEVGFWVEEQRS